MPKWFWDPFLNSPRVDFGGTFGPVGLNFGLLVPSWSISAHLFQIYCSIYFFNNLLLISRVPGRAPGGMDAIRLMRRGNIPLPDTGVPDHCYLPCIPPCKIPPCKTPGMTKVIPTVLHNPKPTP